MAKHAGFSPRSGSVQPGTDPCANGASAPIGQQDTRASAAAEPAWPQHLSTDTDAARLTAAIKGGSRQAETEFVRRYRPGLMTLVRLRCSDVELCKDVVQETLQISLQRLRAGTIEQPQALAGFLRGTAINLLANELRRSERRLSDALLDGWDEQIADEACGPYQSVENEDLSRAVRQAINGLKIGRDRELLWLYYVEQNSKEQLCSHFELSAEHFDRVLHRAKNRLKALWERTLDTWQAQPMATGRACPPAD